MNDHLAHPTCSNEKLDNTPEIPCPTIIEK